MEHTKTPFTYSRKDFSGNEHPYHFYICGNHCESDDREGTICTGIAIVLGNATSIEVTEANAEFIVRACNAHDHLVKACQEVVTYLEHGEGKSPNGLRMISAIETLQAALALASPKP